MAEIWRVLIIFFCINEWVQSKVKIVLLKTQAIKWNVKQIISWYFCDKS